MICAVLAHLNAFSPSIRVTDGLAPAALAALKAGGAASFRADFGPVDLR